MKKYILLLCISYSLLSCKKSDSTFLDYIKVDSVTVVKTPNELLSGFGNVKINSQNVIYGSSGISVWDGYPGNYRFYSDNNFKNNQIKNIVLDGTSLKSDSYYKMLYDDGNNSIISTGSKFYLSTDNGFTYLPYMTSYVLNNTPTFVKYNISYYIMATSCSYYCTGIELHKIIDEQDAIISSTPITDYDIDSKAYVYFYDENVGYIIYESSNTSGRLYFKKTIDGGNTWVDSFYLDNLNSYYFNLEGIKLISPTAMVCYNDYYKKLYTSKDSGHTWDENNLAYISSGNISDLQIVSEDAGYFLTIENSSNYYSTKPQMGYLYKSMDLGKSWQKVSGNKIYSSKLFFKDNNTGIVYTNGIIQKTTDGGKTFELLMYPLR